MNDNQSAASDPAMRSATHPARRKRPGPPKVSTTIRLDADLLAHFREAGPGWQSRINAALRDWLAAGR